MTGSLCLADTSGDCHYLEGNVYAAKRMDLVRYLLEIWVTGSWCLAVIRETAITWKAISMRPRG